MKIKKNLFTAILCILLDTSQAQTISSWIKGVEAGGAYSGVLYGGQLDDTHAVPLFSIIAGYHPSNWQAGLYVGVQYETHYSNNFAFNAGGGQEQALHYLIVPVYTRIGPPTSLAHGIIGGYFADCLNNPPSSPTTYQWALQRQETGVIAGLDARILQLPGIDLVIGFTGRWGLTHMFQADNPRYFNAYADSRAYALALTAYLHSASK